MKIINTFSGFILATLTPVLAVPVVELNSTISRALIPRGSTAARLNCEGPFKDTRIGVCHDFDFRDCVNFNFMACVCYQLPSSRWSGPQGLSSVGFGGSYTRCQLYEDYECSSFQQYYVSKDEPNLFLRHWDNRAKSISCYRVE